MKTFLRGAGIALALGLTLGNSFAYAAPTTTSSLNFKVELAAPTASLIRNRDSESLAGSPPAVLPNDPIDEQYRKTGDIESREGAFVGALDDYDHALQLNPKNALAYLGRGMARISLKDFNNALRDLDKALSLNSKLINARLARTGIYMYQRDFALAAAECNKVISVDHNNAFAYYELGLCDGELGRHTESLETLTHALQIVKSQNDTAGAAVIGAALALQFDQNGRFSAYQGNLSQAIADYSQSLALNNQSATAYLDRAAVEREMGNDNAAAADYSQAIAVAPLLADAYKQRGRFKLERNQYDSAARDFTAAIAIAPQDPELYAERAICFQEEGNSGAAGKDSETARQLVNNQVNQTAAEMETAIQTLTNRS
jgi:tetratricopeptide (TPR) repeat protein